MKIISITILILLALCSQAYAKNPDPIQVGQIKAVKKARLSICEAKKSPMGTITALMPIAEGAILTIRRDSGKVGTKTVYGDLNLEVAIVGAIGDRTCDQFDDEPTSDSIAERNNIQVQKPQEKVMEIAQKEPKTIIDNAKSVNGISSPKSGVNGY